MHREFLLELGLRRHPHVLPHLVDVFLRPVGHRLIAPHKQHRRHRREQQPGDDQRPRPPLPGEIREHPSQRVGKENISRPQQIPMQAPEQRQPSHAPVMDRPRPPPRRFDPAGHQVNSSPEQHREDGHELQIGEEHAHVPHRIVQSVQVSIRRGIHIRLPDHREVLDAHRQDPQKRHATHHVDRLNALSLSHRPRRDNRRVGRDRLGRDNRQNGWIGHRYLLIDSTFAVYFAYSPSRSDTCQQNRVKTAVTARRLPPSCSV